MTDLSDLVFDCSAERDEPTLTPFEWTAALARLPSLATLTLTYCSDDLIEQVLVHLQLFPSSLRRVVVDNLDLEDTDEPALRPPFAVMPKLVQALEVNPLLHLEFRLASYAETKEELMGAAAVQQLMQRFSGRVRFLFHDLGMSGDE